MPKSSDLHVGVSNVSAGQTAVILVRIPIKAATAPMLNAAVADTRATQDGKQSFRRQTLSWESAGERRRCVTLGCKACADDNRPAVYVLALRIAHSGK